ncbi:MAG TPA: hypothetical protein VGH80_10890 [Xanthomonadaceae bacterium]
MARNRKPPAPHDGFRLAAGRALPRLLFLTDRMKLQGNIGAAALQVVLASIAVQPHVLVDIHGVPGRPLDTAALAVRNTLRTHQDVVGVVILGGLDVIPSERRDTVGLPLNAPERRSDADRFVVWSDWVYGDKDNDGLPELPVSRIPDGQSANLFLAALGAPAITALTSRHGVRNLARPFADPIFAKLHGPDAIVCSHPHTSASPGYAARGDHLYFMLHGDFNDATRYWGETTGGTHVEALDLPQLQVQPGAIVLSGACWGGLSVCEPAGANRPNLTPRTAADSLALRCLAQGARGFVGCTGSHYSPIAPPFDSFGAPLHDGFWTHVRAGHGPAQALFNAKGQYAVRLGKGRHASIERIERKLFEQFTVLGLGW